MRRSSRCADAQREGGLLHRARRRRGALAAMLERQLELGAHPAHHHLRLGLLEDGPAHGGQLAGAVLAHVEPADLERAAASPPWKCGTRPQSARSSVDLPEPDTPASTVKVPGLELERDVAQRGPARVRDRRTRSRSARDERITHGPPPAARARPANGAAPSASSDRARAPSSAGPSASSSVG